MSEEKALKIIMYCLVAISVELGLLLTAMLLTAIIQA